MASYNCIIVDDEQLARELLETFISKVPQLELLAKCKNPLEALEVMNREQVDLIFLDIQMPELTGVEFLKTLQQKPLVIFTTAYAEHALEGYSLNVTDYLLKPFSFSRFLQAVNKATEQLNLIRAAKEKPAQTDPEAGREKDFIVLHADHKVYKVSYDDILYIEGLKAYVSFFTKEKRIIALRSMKELEESLPSDRFLRIHKSYIVNTGHVRTLESNHLILGDKRIPIGRSYKSRIDESIF